MNRDDCEHCWEWTWRDGVKEIAVMVAVLAAVWLSKCLGGW